MKMLNRWVLLMTYPITGVWQLSDWRKIQGKQGSGMSNPETRDYRAGRNDIRYFGETLPGKEVGG